MYLIKSFTYWAFPNNCNYKRILLLFKKDWEFLDLNDSLCIVISILIFKEGKLGAYEIMWFSFFFKLVPGPALTSPHDIRSERPTRREDSRARGDRPGEGEPSCVGVSAAPPRRHCPSLGQFGAEGLWFSSLYIIGVKYKHFSSKTCNPNLVLRSLNCMYFRTFQT